MENFESLQKKALKNKVVEESIKYRTLLRRIGAGFIDNSIILIISIIAIFCIKAIDLPGKILFIMALHFFSLSIYNILFIYFFGATPGKMVFGLRVVDFNDGGPVTIKNSILREILNFTNLGLYLYMILQFSNQGILRDSDGTHTNTFQNQLMDLSMTISYIISVSEILTALFSQKRRAIHDFIGNTIVEKKAIENKKITILSVIGSLIVLFVYLKLYGNLFQ